MVVWWSLLVAAVVAALVANYVARKPRVVDTLNARHLQIWGPDGNVQALLEGGKEGASLAFSGDSIADLYLTRRKISFRTAGRSLSKDGDEDDPPMVDRVELGVDGDGSGVLRFYSDILDDFGPVTEFKLTRGGVHKARLRVGSPHVDIAETPEGLVISPGERADQSCWDRGRHDLVMAAKMRLRLWCGSAPWQRARKAAPITTPAGPFHPALTAARH